MLNSHSTHITTCSTLAHTHIKSTLCVSISIKCGWNIVNQCRHKCQFMFKMKANGRMNGSTWSTTTTSTSPYDVANRLTTPPHLTSQATMANGIQYIDYSIFSIHNHNTKQSTKWVVTLRTPSVCILCAVDARVLWQASSHCRWPRDSNWFRPFDVLCVCARFRIYFSSHFIFVSLTSTTSKHKITKVIIERGQTTENGRVGVVSRWQWEKMSTTTTAAAAAE